MNLKKKEILFSVVIPLYNKEKYITNTIDSVLKQSYKNFEIIIIDDGCTDNSIDQINKIKDSRIHLFRQKNKGVSVARNRGVRESTGDYIVLLDADDEWLPCHLSCFILSIKKYPLEFVFCNNYRIKYVGNNVRTTEFSNFKNVKDGINLINNFFDCSLINSIATSSTICLKKEIFKEYYFDENLNSGEDTDLWIRLGLKYKFVLNYKVSSLINKLDKNSLSKQNFINNEFKITQKYLKEESSNESLKRFIDINRLSTLIKYKALRNLDKIKILKTQINIDNLNYKQKLILNLPNFIIPILNLIKKYLNFNGVYFSIFK